MIKIKAEKREASAKKQKSAPRGGTRGGQALRLAVQKGYIGLPRALKPHIRIVIKEP